MKELSEGVAFVRRIPATGRDPAQNLVRVLLLRAWRKSLPLSTLANYYYAAKADDYESLFGKLAIGKQPTPLRNRYFLVITDLGVGGR